MTADEVRILHAGERLSKLSGMFADIMHGSKEVKPASLIPVLDIGVQGESRVPAATVRQLLGIVAKVRLLAPLN